MAETILVLGQVVPNATTDTVLYTVPAAHSAIASSIVACNRGANPVAIRVGVSVGGGAMADADYLYYELSIPSHDTFAAVLGLTLAAADEVRVYAATADMTFSLFGTEVT
jgi:hypothetical protein